MRQSATTEFATHTALPEPACESLLQVWLWQVAKRKQRKRQHESRLTCGPALLEARLDRRHVHHSSTLVNLLRATRNAFQEKSHSPIVNAPKKQAVASKHSESMAIKPLTAPTQSPVEAPLLTSEA